MAESVQVPILQSYSSPLQSAEALISDYSWKVADKDKSIYGVLVAGSTGDSHPSTEGCGQLRSPSPAHLAAAKILLT
uniref:Uncharacterized protein n=1 Tax=Leersia perrieri TaxID=77586 RepID=A0A0D9W216_9ORYZ